MAASPERDRAHPHPSPNQRGRSGAAIATLAAAADRASTAEPVATTLQRRAGNRAVASLLDAGPDRHLDRRPDRHDALTAGLRVTPAQEKAAIAFVRGHYDVNSIRVIQVIVGTKVDGNFGPVSAHAVATFPAGRRAGRHRAGGPADAGRGRREVRHQRAAGLRHLRGRQLPRHQHPRRRAHSQHGKIGRITVNRLVMGIVGAGDRNSAIRAIVDFFRLDDNGLVDIHFSSTDANNATTTDQAIPGNSAITVGPSAFAQGWAGLVHTIAHEFEHVRQNRVGIADLPISEFLGERVEILSKGMDEEDLAGFMDDARRALAQWNLMPAAQRRANFTKFVEVRNKVRARLAKAAKVAPLSAQNAATLAGYNAVVKP